MSRARPTPNLNPTPTSPIRLRQRSQIGVLWQLDATLHRWFPNCPQPFLLLNLPDDCTRVFTGSNLYQSENRLACFDLSLAALTGHDRPLQSYVACHSLCFTHVFKVLKCVRV